MHLLHIAIVFLGVNYCILQYSIAFLAAIAIATAIVLMAIANALSYTVGNESPNVQSLLRGPQKLK